MHLFGLELIEFPCCLHVYWYSPDLPCHNRPPWLFVLSLFFRLRVKNSTVSSQAMEIWDKVSQSQSKQWLVCFFVCFFVCCKTRKSLLRMPALRAQRKPPFGVYPRGPRSSEALPAVLLKVQRYTTTQNHSTCQPSTSWQVGSRPWTYATPI